MVTWSGNSLVGEQPGKWVGLAMGQPGQVVHGATWSVRQGSLVRGQPGNGGQLSQVVRGQSGQGGSLGKWAVWSGGQGPACWEGGAVCERGSAGSGVKQNKGVWSNGKGPAWSEATLGKGSSLVRGQHRQGDSLIKGKPSRIVRGQSGRGGSLVRWSRYNLVRWSEGRVQSCQGTAWSGGLGAARERAGVAWLGFRCSLVRWSLGGGDLRKAAWE